jgi:hypothetical protein
MVEANTDIDFFVVSISTSLFFKEKYHYSQDNAPGRIGVFPAKISVDP